MVEIAIEDVDDSVRTEQRDKAAREINEWVEQGDWPLTPNQMEAKGEFSRQHYRNVMQLYGVKENGTEPEGTHIDIPPGMDVRSYLRGFADATDA